MSLKFRGSLGEFRSLINGLALKGSWSPQPNGVVMFRDRRGGNVHWAVGSKTVWFSGKPEPVAWLRDAVVAALSAPVQGRAVTAKRPSPLDDASADDGDLFFLEG